MAQRSCAFALEAGTHVYLVTRMLIMQGIWTKGGLLQVMSSFLLEVLFLGDLVYRIAHPCQPPKLSTL